MKDLVTFTEEILNGKLHFCVVKKLTEILMSFVNNRKGVIYFWTVVDLGDGSQDIDHYLRTSLINDP